MVATTHLAADLTASGADFAMRCGSMPIDRSCCRATPATAANPSADRPRIITASRYFKANGSITIDDKPVEVSGQAWMDREWSSQPLAPDQSGWDWFSLHLKTGEKLMLFRIRQTDGPNYCSGNWISPDGDPQQIAPSGIEMTPTATDRNRDAQVADSVAHRNPRAGLAIEAPRSIRKAGWRPDFRIGKDRSLSPAAIPASAISR